MYISATVWTFISTLLLQLHCYAITKSDATNTRVCQSHLQKKSTILKYYSLAYTFTYKDGEFIDIYQKLSPLQGRSRGQSNGRSSMTSLKKGPVYTGEMTASWRFLAQKISQKMGIRWRDLSAGLASRCLMANIEYCYLPFCSKYCD